MTLRDTKHSHNFHNLQHALLKGPPRSEPGATSLLLEDVYTALVIDSVRAFMPNQYTKLSGYIRGAFAGVFVFFLGKRKKKVKIKRIVCIESERYKLIYISPI